MIETIAHPYGWLSLLPSLVAILLAIATRRVVISLIIGLYAGALILTGYDPIAALYDLCVIHAWPSVTSGGKLRVFCFTMLMGAMIGIIHRTGGMQGLVEKVAPLASTRRTGQLTTWLMGMIIFFDDYANTLLLGSTCRSLCDRLKISREKLAYMVDSTAAPVAGLALVSTWVAVEIDYVQQGLDTIEGVGDLKAFTLFLSSIPYRFYMLMALLFVPLVAILQRDFGPMLRAEQDTVAGSPSYARNPADEFGSEDVVTAGWHHAVIPIGLTLAVVLVLLYKTGTDNLAAEGEQAAPIHEVFGAADSSVALQYGALVGIITAIAMAATGKILTGGQILAAGLKGVRVVLPAIAILSCAATLSNMTSNRSVEGKFSDVPYEFQNHRLYTGDYLKGLIAPEETSETTDSDRTLKRRLLPTIVFILASVVAFCTGTSWGTMGILMPMVVPLAFALLKGTTGGVSPDDPILLASIGGVLAGAVFGDHCSPISDTTVLSSQASGCDHIAHVRTQLPYAVVVALIAIIFGTLPLGWGVGVWLLLPTQLIAMIGVLLIFGKRSVEQH